MAILEPQSAPAWWGRRDVLERLRVLRGLGRRLVPSRGNSLMGDRGTWDTEESTKQLIFWTLAERSPVLELLISVARPGLEVAASSRTRRSTSSRGLASLLLCLHQPLSSRCQRVADGGLPLLKPLLQAAPRSVLSYPRDSPS